MNDQVEEEYLDEDEEEYEEGPFRRWGIIIGVGAGVICLGLILAVWFGNDFLRGSVAQLNATETATVTMTVAPTETATQVPPTDIPTSTPTIEPSPTAVRLPAMEVMALVSGPPVMEDRFEDNSKTWAAVGDNSEFTIQEGSLILRSTAAGQPGLVYCSGSCGPYKDFYYYEAEMVDERASDSGYGLVFALNQQKTGYYSFKVRPNTSEYGLFKVNNGIATPLIDWTSSTAVLPAPQQNILGVRFMEKTIDLFLNGTRINSYTDQNPFSEGQIGFGVDQDGVRMMAQRAIVYELIPRTPQPTVPGQTAPPTQPIVTQPVATQPAAIGQPTQPALPTQPPIATTAAPVRFTPTPTARGSCPSYVPEGQWLLVVTLADPNARRVKITINGTVYELKQFNTPFYLYLNQHYTVDAGGRVYNFQKDVCKVEFIRAK